MEVLNFKYAPYVLGVLFTISSLTNAWMTYKMNRLDDTIQDQMNGKYSKEADLLRRTNERLNTVESSMVSRKELEDRAEQIIKGLDANTQEAIKKYTNDTKSRIDSISTQVVSMQGVLEGVSNLQKAPKLPPPPKEWKGITQRDRERCSQYPDRCDSFLFRWESPHKVKGKTIASFSNPNLWAGKSKLDLNLAFKVIAIRYAEDQSRLGAGAAENQGIHIQAGYVSDKGEFVLIEGLETKMYKGDPRIQGKLFYVPKKSVDSTRTMKLFEPSLLVGTTYQSSQFGLSIGGSLLNLKEGEYRFGANFVITKDKPYLGIMGSWHPVILGKNLNIAPNLGWVLSADQEQTWSLGLQFQVW